ncbi:MAG: hypothetical protein DCF17_04890 [Shackletoniella antarctica]|uniref:Uncharacterized protein n=1 Tax=Shackletoniella antarctica TaxID=268115 RepID=A0A2W4WQ07_9CYAN|nr:MAG: hypothetical protein DCF17_04890 [Shackletoniella antarctica]
MNQMSIFDEAENVGQENEDDVIVQLADFHQAVIWGTDWTTGTIVNQLNKGNIDLNPASIIVSAKGSFNRYLKGRA